MIVLDTDVISYTIRSRPPMGLIRRLAGLDPEVQATTAINVGELIYGAHRSPRAEHYLSALERLVWPSIQVLSFDRLSAEIFGGLRAQLERTGSPVAEPDLRIASICLRHGALLATGNTRHFTKIPGLDVEDWLGPFR